MKRKTLPKLMLPPCTGCAKCGAIYGPFTDEWNFSNHDGRDRLFTYTGGRYLCVECFHGR